MKGYTLQELQAMKQPQQSGGLTLQQLQGMKQAQTNPLDGFANAAGNQSVLGAGLQAGKTALMNTPRSAFNMGKDLLSVAKDPIGALRGIGNIGLGGVAKLLPGTQPEEEQFNQFTSAIKNRYGSLDALQKTATEDPFAFGADLVGLLQGGATLAGKTAQVNNILSKTGQLVTKPITKTVGGVGNMVSEATKFGVSQSTGLNKDTIAELIRNPQKFKEINPELRTETARQVGDALDSRLGELSDLGSGYQGIRETMSPVSIPQGTIEGVLKKYGVELDGDRKIVTSAESRPLSATDRTALQDFIDNYGSQNEYTSNSFLNTREALSNLSKYESGKTGLPQQIARDLRSQYDKAGKEQIPGLKDLDAEFAPERELLGQLKKDIFDAKGNLKDGAMSKIAKITGKGKEKLLERMKEIVPDIEQRVEILKAVEDIENASGFKVGTYIRGATTGGAVLTGNIPLIVGAILSQPKIAVPLLRGAGYVGEKARPVLEALKNISNDVNNFTVPKPLLDFADDPKFGLSIRSSLTRTDSKTGLPLDAQGYIDKSKITEIPAYFEEKRMLEANSKGGLAKIMPEEWKKDAMDKYVQETNNRRAARAEEGPVLDKSRASSSYLGAERRVAEEKARLSNSLNNPEFKPIKDATPATGLSAEDFEVENAAFEKIRTNPQQAINEYLAIPEAQNGKIANADLARRIFKEQGYKGTNSAAVHEPASAITKVIYNKGLKNPGDAVIFVGGSGTGKSSAVNSIFSDDLNKAAVILDGNLSSMKSASRAIKAAHDAGKTAHLIYVYRDPIDSWVNGVIARMNDNVSEAGRIVPSSVVAENHIGSYNVASEILNKIARGELQNVKIDFLDNSLGKGNQRLMSIGEFANVKYPTVEQLKAQLIKNIDGKLKPEQIKALSE